MLDDKIAIVTRAGQGLGLPPRPRVLHYKGGVAQLTRGHDRRPRPSRALHCYCPRVIEMPLARKHFESVDDPEALERVLVSPQLIDRMGSPEEVARLVCFLASDDESFITGALYLVDGGQLAWETRQKA